MPGLRSCLLYASVLAALAAGCSPTDQAPSGQVGAGGSSGSAGARQEGSGGSTTSGGGLTAGAGGSEVAGTGGSAATGGVTGTGNGGTDVAGMGGQPTTGGVGGAGTGGKISTGGVPGTGGTTSAGGSGGGQPSPGCGNTAAPKGAQNLTMQVSGKGRTYLLFVPNGYDAKKPIPLISPGTPAGPPVRSHGSTTSWSLPRVTARSSCIRMA